MIRLKLINKKILSISAILNIIFILYFLNLVLNPKPDFFGSTGDFMNILIIYPLIIFILSFIFKNRLQKIAFNYLSVIGVYGVLLDDLIITNFNRITLEFFIAYLVYPLISALIADFIIKIFYKSTK